MPRNRAEVDRSEKTEAILDVAQAQLAGGGFSSLSVAAIARDLGVAQNAVYWYFPSKDDLLVAVARRRMEQRLVDPPIGAAPYEQAVWLLDQLESERPVRDAVLSRASASAVVGAYREEVHALMHDVVAAWLTEVAPDDDLDLLTEAVLAAAEGLLLQNADRAQRNRVLRFGLDRLLGQS